MKKFIALLLVLVMGLSLCACDSNNVQMENPEVTIPDNPLYETLQEKMCIDFTHQDLQSIDITEDSASVSLNNCGYFDPKSVFEMGNGTTLQLPMTYGELCDAGWELDYQEISDPYPTSQYNRYVFINSDGKTISAEIVNHTNSPIDVRKAEVAQLALGYFHTENFSINGIEPGATVTEILLAFGLPASCGYYEDETGPLSFHLLYRSKNDEMYTVFYISPETNRLIGIECNIA